MDITSLDTKAAAQEGADMQLRNPITEELLYDGDTGIPVTINLLGTDSREYQSATHKIGTKRLEAASRSGKIKVTAEALDDEQLECLLEVTKGWVGIAEGDSPLEFSRLNARRIYINYPWIREQAEDFINSRGNFLGESKKHS